METTNIFEHMSSTDLGNTTSTREVGDVLSEIKTHLTKEELLLFSLYKNSKKKSNQIPKLFLEKYYDKKLTSSAISHRKKRLMKVLYHVGILLRYKQAYNIDYSIKQVLTHKQFLIFMLYERRVGMKEIWEKVYDKGKWEKNIKNSRPISTCFYRALTRLEDCANTDIPKYLELLKNVLQYSRKYPISKQ